MYVVIFISHLFLLSLASEKSNVSDWSIIPKSNLLCDLECACPCPAGAQSWFSLSFCSVQGSRLNFCNQWLSKCYLFENNTVISLLTGISRPNPLKYRHRRGYSSVISLHWTMLGVLLQYLGSLWRALCVSPKTLPIIENWLYDEIISWNYISVLLESHPASSLSLTCLILAYSRKTAWV